MIPRMTLAALVSAWMKMDMSLFLTSKTEYLLSTLYIKPIPPGQLCGRVSAVPPAPAPARLHPDQGVDRGRIRQVSKYSQSGSAKSRSGVFPKVLITKFGNSIRESGFIPLAARNNIVVVFPQIKANFYNAGGCWNAFGYLPADSAGSQYATKQGKQMRAVARMVEKIANVSMF